MKEHFKDQIEAAVPLTQEMIDSRIDSNDWWKSASAGDKILYFMVRTSGVAIDGSKTSSMQMRKTFESELETLATTHNFVEMSSGATPRLELK